MLIENANNINFQLSLSALNIIFYLTQYSNCVILSLVVYLLITLLSLSQAEANSKYKEAIKTATRAALKQSGLEADFIKVRKTTETKAQTWVRENDLETPASVVTFVVPIIYKEKVRVRSGDFIFEGDKSKLLLKFDLQF